MSWSILAPMVIRRGHCLRMWTHIESCSAGPVVCKYPSFVELTAGLSAYDCVHCRSALPQQMLGMIVHWQAVLHCNNECCDNSFIHS
jgi:hypothetical protein